MAQATTSAEELLNPAATGSVLVKSMSMPGSVAGCSSAFTFCSAALQ